jgi:hypothetical protein
MRRRLIDSLCIFLICCSIGVVARRFQQDRDFGFRIQFGPDVERLLRQSENHTRQFAAMSRKRSIWFERTCARAESQLNMVGGNFDEREL